MNMHIWPDKPDRVSSAHFKRPHNIENSWYMAILPFWGKLIIVKVRCHELYAIIRLTDMYLLYVY
jgi:hypothetical protein